MRLIIGAYKQKASTEITRPDEINMQTKQNDRRAHNQIFLIFLAWIAEVYNVAYNLTVDAGSRASEKILGNILRLVFAVLRGFLTVEN